MTNLKDKLKNLGNIASIGLAVIAIASVGYGIYKLSNFQKEDKEAQKISKSEGIDYFTFYDGNGKVYQDVGKDETLDYFYDAKGYPITDFGKTIEIIDAPDEAKNYKFKQILRNSDEAINLQKKFDEIKKMYGKQGEGR